MSGVRSADEVPLRERPTGAGLQVPLKGDGTRFVGECEENDTRLFGRDSPWFYAFDLLMLNGRDTTSAVARSQGAARAHPAGRWHAGAVPRRHHRARMRSVRRDLRVTWRGSWGSGRTAATRPMAGARPGSRSRIRRIRKRSDGASYLRSSSSAVTAPRRLARRNCNSPESALGLIAMA
jgi:hypothetical protein